MIEVMIQVQVLGARMATGEDGAGISARCNARVSHFGNHFMMRDIVVFAKNQASLQAEIRKGVEAELRAREKAALFQIGEQKLSVALQATQLEFGVPMDEEAFAWLVERAPAT